MTGGAGPSAEVVVPIERGHEIRTERVVSWIQASFDAMTNEQRVEAFDAIKFAVATLVPQDKPGPDNTALAEQPGPSGRP